jgi:hypothetical protein
MQAVPATQKKERLRERKERCWVRGSRSQIRRKKTLAAFNETLDGKYRIFQSAFCHYQHKNKIK